MATRTVLVTGASKGIGKACAERAAKAGYRVALAARSKDKLDELAAALQAQGSEAYSVTLDLSSNESIVEAIKKTAAEFGRIDVLVNNGGITRDGLSMRMKPEDWSDVLQANLTGAFVAFQQVVTPMMRERWGRIINISSVVGQTGNAGQANYAASKAGLIGLTKTLAREVGSRNITVNAVAPGFVETDMTGVLPEELKQKMVADTPLRRMGTPEEIAAAVLFLMSDEAAFITGHVLDVNGGLYM